MHPEVQVVDRDRARLSLLASALAVVAWAVLQPPTADLAAQVYRAGLFERAGWVLWDNNWFGGHQLPGYSLLTPWLMASAGIGATGAVAAATTTVAFAAIVRTLRRHDGLWATAWVAWAAVGDLLIGRASGHPCPASWWAEIRRRRGYVGLREPRAQTTSARPV